MNVEVYVLLPEDVDLLKWAEMRLSVPKLVDDAEDIRIYRAFFEGSQVALTVTPRMEGGDFTSVFFSGPRLPWRTDAECARDAAHSLHAIVRCVPDGVHQEAQWLEVSADGERIVLWEASG